MGETASPVRAASAAISEPTEILSFRLGGEEYGIDIMRVREIWSCEPPTRIPHAPHFIKGFINLRGEIVPIDDLRLKLGCETAEYTSFTAVVVLEALGHCIGAVVDSVSDVLTLISDSIKPAPRTNASVDTSYILGISCFKSQDIDRVIILTDIDTLMSSAAMNGSIPSVAA
ncbi:MAG: chemotaxis protein CheW [Burkholderiales bacterium PBB3]|nr:MAG: chemotaxis protein CheW [Burkholderiales bacterium PBB3]